MAAPVVSWYNFDNTAVVSSLAFGVVDAGSVSANTTLLVWNNRGGASALSDMTNCTITTKDNLGGNTGEIIVDKWVEVRVDSMAETTFTAVGGATTKAVKADAQAAGVIKGAINDGTVLNASANFAKVSIHANVPSLATAGVVNFLTRVAYQYV